MSVWECLCVTRGAVACLRGDLFWHVSCAVKAYCVWVITCHCKPWALLTPQSLHCCCFSIALPLCLSLSPMPVLALSFWLLCPSDSHFLLCFETVSLVRKDHPHRAGAFFYLFLLLDYMYMIYFCDVNIFHLTFSRKPQNYEIPTRSGCSFHLKPCKTCNKQVQRWLLMMTDQLALSLCVGRADYCRKTSLLLLCLSGGTGAVQCTMWDYGTLSHYPVNCPVLFLSMIYAVSWVSRMSHWQADAVNVHHVQNLDSFN